MYSIGFPGDINIINSSGIVPSGSTPTKIVDANKNRIRLTTEVLKDNGAVQLAHYGGSGVSLENTGASNSVSLEWPYSTVEVWCLLPDTLTTDAHLIISEYIRSE